MTDTLERLAEVLEARKQADPDSSYVAKLYAKGLDAILKKIGEEATETVMAAKGRRAAERLVSEVADLRFHSLVLLAQQDLGPQAVLAELDPPLRAVGAGGEGAPGRGASATAARFRPAARQAALSIDVGI